MAYSGRLKALCALGPPLFESASPKKSWKLREGRCWAFEGWGWLRHPHGLSLGKWDWEGRCRYGWQSL